MNFKKTYLSGFAMMGGVTTLLIIGCLLNVFTDINEYIVHGIIYFAVVGMLAFPVYEFLVKPIWKYIYKSYLRHYGIKTVAKIISKHEGAFDRINPTYYLGLEYEITDRNGSAKKYRTKVNILEYYKAERGEISYSLYDVNKLKGQNIDIVYNKLFPKSAQLAYLLNLSKSPLKTYIRVIILLSTLIPTILYLSFIKNYMNEGNEKVHFNILTGITTKEEYKKNKLISESKSTLIGKVGMAREYYLNGQIKSEKFYKKGIVNGLSKYYYENGNLEREEEIVMKRNKEVKNSKKTYYEDGSPKREIITNINDNGDKSEIDKTYYEDGNINSESFKDEETDEKNYRAYYDSGQLKEEYFENISKNKGVKKYYFRNGDLLKEEIINEDSHLVKTYYQNKKIHTESTDNKKTKLKTDRIYFENGQLKQEKFFKNNKRDGIEKEYLENGNVRKEIPYKNDKLHGIVKEYHNNGIIKEETPYNYGKREGIEKYYYNNGNIKMELRFENDVRDGDAIWYNENGEVRSKNQKPKTYKSKTMKRIM